jgi:hypothetical protein
MVTTQVDRLTGSLTEGWRALNHSTDRFAAIRRFASYLNDGPASNSVLLFYGDGGNGKSLLLRHLRGHCIKRFDPNDVRALRERLTGRR